MPEGTAGVTVNRFCGSSMQSVHQAAGAIRMGAGDAFVCAGVESMSRVPMMGFNPMPHPGLAKDFPQAYISMGETAENVAQRHQVTRRDQEEFAARSHRKAAAAQEAGRLAEEIVPIAGPKGKVVERDGCIRPETTAEGLAGLEAGLPAGRHGDGRHLLAADGWRGGGAGVQRRIREGARAGAVGEGEVDRGLRLLAGGDGHGAGERLAEGAGARGHQPRATWTWWS